MWGKEQSNRFWKDDSATATVEFVIVFPIVLFVFIAAFETAMLLTRQVMLERSLDGAVRHLRLTAGVTATHEQIRDNICANTPILLNCREALVLDLRAVDRTSYVLPDYHTQCIDRTTGQVSPANQFNPGTDNQLMLIRVCALVDRILPISGLGLNLTRDDTGAIHLTAASIFVNEPAAGG